MPKLATLMDSTGTDVLAYMGFSAQHRVELHFTHSVERLHGKVERRSALGQIG